MLSETGAPGESAAVFEEDRRFIAPADDIGESESQTATVRAFRENMQLANATVFPHFAGKIR